MRTVVKKVVGLSARSCHDIIRGNKIRIRECSARSRSGVLLAILCRCRRVCRRIVAIEELLPL